MRAAAPSRLPQHYTRRAPPPPPPPAPPAPGPPGPPPDPRGKGACTESASRGGPRITREPPLENRCVRGGIPAPKGAEGNVLEPDRAGVEEEALYLPFPHLPDDGRRGEGDFVQPVGPMDHERMAVARFGEDPRVRFSEFLAVHPDDLSTDAGGIADRSEDVEDRADGDLTPRPDRIFHRGMEPGGEHEGDPGLVEGPLHPRRIRVEIHPEGFQHVRASGPAGHGSVPVLGHGDAGPRGDECHGGGDVEGAGTVSSRTAGVEHLLPRLP